MKPIHCILKVSHLSLSIGSSQNPSIPLDRKTALVKWLDSNCKCHLKLGLSSEFSKMMNTSSMPTDPIDSIFLEATEQKTLKKRFQGMKDNYQDVQNGSKKSVTCYPAGFNFDGRIKRFNTVVIKQLDQIKKNMEKQTPGRSDQADQVAQNLQSVSQQHGSYLGKYIKAEIDNRTGISQKAKKMLEKHFNDTDLYDEKYIKSKIDLVSHETDIEAIKDFLKTIKPQDSERRVYERILSLFANERGLLLHSMITDVYLQMFVNDASRERKANKTGKELSDLEKKIAKALNITNFDLDNAAQQVLSDLQNNGLSSPYQLNDVIQCINNNRKIHHDLKQKMKKQFNSESAFDDSFICDALRLATYEHETKFPGELDLLGMFPDHQMILHVEVKSNQVENKKNDNNLKGASEQMSRYAKHIAKRHGSVLSDGWSYCKVAAIVPGVVKEEDVCAHCRHFLLTDNELDNDKTVRVWWESLSLYKNDSQDESAKDQCYREFLMFFNRAVNLSSIARKINVFNSWEEIEGENQPPVVAGFTSSTGAVSCFQDILTRAHDAFKTIYFTPEQMSLLSPKDFFRVLLLADFGAGMI